VSGVWYQVSGTKNKDRRSGLLLEKGKEKVPLSRMGRIRQGLMP